MHGGAGCVTSVPLVECRSVTSTSSPSARTSAWVREMSCCGLGNVTRRGRSRFVTRDTWGARPSSTVRSTATTWPVDSTSFAGGASCGAATRNGPGTSSPAHDGSWSRIVWRSLLRMVIPDDHDGMTCLLYTSDAADDLLCVDLG